MAAMLGFVLSPGRALAQTVTLSPSTAINIAGPSATHTVSATVTGVTGHCVEGPGTCTGDSTISCKTDAICVSNFAGTCSGVVDPDPDGDGDACTSDSDCDQTFGDDFCSFSGFPVGFQVTGVNPHDTSTTVLTDALGVASHTYTDTLGVGVDSIQACLDLFLDPGETTAECLAEVGGDPTDIASNTVTKQWTAALAGTVDLEPSSAVNPVNAPHNVTATVTGVARCTGGTNDGTICTDDFACTGGGTCTDKSGLIVGFNINSGPSAGDKGWILTDSLGVATLPPYTSVVAGTDVLQACLDADPIFGGNDEDFGLVANCILDVGTEPDFKSNLANKRWDPTVLLENLDNGATIALGSPQYTQNPAYNPVASMHTVRATVSGAAKICFGGTAGANSYAACSVPGDCTNGGTCGVAGYPVFFGVTGQNPGDLPFVATDVTDATGKVSKTYTDSNGSGLDTIQACVDADPADFGTLPDSGSFSQCLSEYPAEADVPSNTVLKYWLSKFVTGGGKVVRLKAWDTFGGTVGQKPNSTAIVGEWQQVAHGSKGGNLQCHWNAFSAFALSCSTASCGTQPDTVVFTTSGGSSTCGNETVKIVDGQKKPDTIQVTGAISALLWTPSSLVSGNFTIHK